MTDVTTSQMTDVTTLKMTVMSQHLEVKTKEELLSDDKCRG